LLVAAHFVPQLFSIFVYESWPDVEWRDKGKRGIHLYLVQKKAAPVAHPDIALDWLAAEHVYILHLHFQEHEVDLCCE
jgi:hypothetical protein